MAKYIDADRLIRRLENRPYKAVPNFIKMVEEQEAADVVEVRHGKWEDPEDLTCYKCSVCGEYATQEYGLTEPRFWRFCPNCGSFMDLEYEEE